MQSHSDAPFATSSSELYFTTTRFIPPDWIGVYLPVTALGLLGALIILANSFVIGFYKAKWREAIPLMYIMIAVCDSVTGVVSICHAGMFANYPVSSLLLHGWGFDMDSFIVIVYIMLHSCTRTSLFYNTMLSVVRTINITKPFLQLKRSIIISSVILYPIIWVIVLIIDVHLLFPVAMTAVVVSMPGMGIASYLFKNATPGAIPYSFLIIFLVLPLVVPSVVCLASDLYHPETFHHLTANNTRKKHDCDNHNADDCMFGLQHFIHCICVSSDTQGFAWHLDTNYVHRIFFRNDFTLSQCHFKPIDLAITRCST